MVATRTNTVQVRRSDVGSRSRDRLLPEVCNFVRVLCKERAQGRPGARRTRGLVCIGYREKRTRAYRFSGNTPAFPAQWLYDLYVISLVAMLCHHRRRFLTRRLDASLGAPGPHDFAVRECPYVALSRLKHSRPPQPAPTFVTFASAPLAGQDGRIEPVICGEKQGSIL